MSDATIINSLTPWVVVLVAAAVGAWTDTVSRRLPNALTLPLWALGLAWGVWSGGAWGLAGALGASVVVAMPFVVLFLVARGGAGDAKMMAGVGAWLGLSHGLVALAAVTLVGAGAAVLTALWRREARLVAGNLGRMLTGAMAVAGGHVRPGEAAAFMPTASSMHRFPYGVAILLGCAGAFAGVQPWVSG